MPGLRPFRTIPENLREWTQWMRAQELGSVTTTTTTIDGTVTVVTTVAGRWVIEDFSGNYTLREGDDGKLLRSTSGSSTNFTVDKGWLSGQAGQVVVLQYGAGAVTIVAGSGVTIRTPTTLAINEQYGSITLIQMAADEYMIAGRMTP